MSDTGVPPNSSCLSTGSRVVVARKRMDIRVRLIKDRFSAINVRLEKIFSDSMLVLFHKQRLELINSLDFSH